MVIKYHLLNIDCAHCAAEISETVSNLSEINSANVDFSNNLIYIDFKKIPDEKLIMDIKEKIESIESNAKFMPYVNLNGKDKKQFIDFAVVIISLFVFVCGFLVKPMNYNLYAILSVIATIICGYDTFKKGFFSFFKFKLEEKSLMTIAAFSAFIIHDFNESFFLILLFKIGSIIERLAVNNSRRHIKSLASIMPDEAFLTTEDGEKKVSVNSLKINDIINVHPFEKIPTDGIVIDGVSSLNPFAITGESLPLEAKKGTEVLSGMINNSGNLTIKVTAAAKDSAAGKIVKMIEEASLKKANTENFISKFAKIYTPIVIILAILLCVIPPLFSFGEFNLWFRRALVFLVASCPCAIVISVPLAFFSGIAVASKLGVLFKGSKYMEVLSKADTFVFDKTATLTTGKLSISEIIIFDENFDKDKILNLAAAVEVYSLHPVAMAVKAAVKPDLKIYTAENIIEYPGLGVKANIENQSVSCGNRKFFVENDYEMESFEDYTFYIAVNEKIIAAISFCDTVRKTSPITINELKKLGIKQTIILSGDSETEVKKVARDCNVDDFYFKLLSEDKLETFNKIKNTTKNIIYVGDGINDAPTLATADCGIAMGQGSFTAIEVGDIILLDNDIKKLPNIVKLSRKVMDIIRFNVTFSLLVKLIVLVFASVINVPMWIAVSADTMVTVLTILNSLPNREMEIKRAAFL